MSSENTTSNFLRRIARENVRRSRSAHALDFAAERLVADRVQADIHILAFAQVGAVEFADLGNYFQLGEIEDVGNRNTGLDLVTIADIRYLHTGDEDALAILSNCH
jgi:hypothetical protein